MHLVLDIGNTNISFGLFDEDQMVDQWPMESKAGYPVAFYELGIKNRFIETNIDLADIDKITISSVVPELIHPLEDMLALIFGVTPSLVKAEEYPIISFAIENPLELGTDLFCNAIAAHTLLPGGSVIVDLGTALTFTVIDHKGTILGVAIAPGIRTALFALYQNTAQLPDVPVSKPESSIGRNTAAAIQAGVIGGYLGLIREKVSAIRKEFGSELVVVGTGGFAHDLHELADLCDRVDPNFTIQGIRIFGDSRD